MWCKLEPGKREGGSSMSNVGFVGLGAMGSRVAARLLDAGNALNICNRTRAKAQPLIERGARWCESPRQVAEASEILFSMVTDDAALDAIASGPDGVLAGLRPGAVYVDMSTVSPRASQELAGRVRALGAQMLDAPVSGSIPQAENGTLAIFVGGEKGAFATVAPLLHEAGEKVTRVGENGHGLLLKLAVNISLAVQVLAFSEGLLLAERGGIEPRLAAETMGSSSIASPMLEARIPLLLDLPEDAWFDVALMAKDIRLAREAASKLAIPLPSAAVAEEMLARAQALGYAHRDLAALHEVLARTAADEVGPPNQATP
jgi:3-hydroxyisobutyrate dehydrogenase-like beta-hydroxyacid dehydrogenase